jgi:serine/threonine-protein kinase
VADIVAPEFVLLQQAVIGRYSLERELGRGGMGVVFLARDVALDRPVAIKLLPPALALRPGLRDRFLAEARTAAKLSQPNIVPIHSVEEVADLVFFVMAYVEGETLGERLRGKGPLTPNEAARMLQEVAWALGYAHGRGVVHRDIKPDNIMLERGSGRAIVMDFGIAGAATSAGGGEVLGTAQYISPEQANGDPVDGRSDLYSLGAVAFLALTGRLPFDAEDAASLLAMHITRPAPTVLSASPGLPRKLAQAVDRCLAKGPADRFPDGEALAEAVGTAVERARELPVPLRLWLTKGQDSKMVYVMWYGLLGTGFAMVTGTVVNSIFHNPTLALLAAVKVYFFTPVIIHAGHRVYELRRLLSAGYSVEDAKIAVRDLAVRRREELTYQFGGEPPLWAKVTRALMWASGLTFAGSMVATLVLQSNVPTAVIVTFTASAAAWFGNALMQVLRPGKRITEDKSAEWRLQFWNSRFAKWFEKLAKFGLKKSAKPAELTYRPTELAISMAADALFESLPKDQRKELKELPSVMERLQKDAALMRRTVDDLGGALAGLGEQNDAGRSSALAGAAPSSAGAQLIGTRAKLRGDLTAKRDEAAGRLADAVAALENIRLSLLRLKAGTGTLDELTADLTAARALNQAMEHAAEAREEVERFLKTGRTSRPLTPPEPHRV